MDSPSYADPRDDYQNPAAAESVSVIDRFSNFDGVFQSSRDVRVEGQAKGTITCQGTLHVAQGASIDAKVDAENIIVAGELEGDILCKGKLQILATGRVRGKIETVSLVINEGAFYEGQLEMASDAAALPSGRSNRIRTPLPSTASSTNPVPINGDQARSSTESTPGGNTFIRRFGGQEQHWDTEPRPEEPAATEDE
jgi:cytoskeletal protein CcmA (bactofilin family)